MDFGALIGGFTEATPYWFMGRAKRLGTARIAAVLATLVFGTFATGALFLVFSGDAYGTFLGVACSAFFGAATFVVLRFLFTPLEKHLELTPEGVRLGGAFRPVLYPWSIVGAIEVRRIGAVFIDARNGESVVLQDFRGDPEGTAARVRAARDAALKT